MDVKVESNLWQDFDAGTKYGLAFQLRGPNGRVREARRLQLVEALEYLAACQRSSDRDSRDANS